MLIRARQLFPYKSSKVFFFILFFFNSNCHKILFFNARGFKLGHLDVFNVLFSISGILKVATHNFMKSTM